MAEFTPGVQIAGYRIEELLGRGGMSRVYRAEQIALQRPVALKVLMPDVSGDSAYRERFLRESRLAAAIEHPNIVPIYDAGESDGQLYIAMRLVHGTDLRTLLQSEGTLVPGRALSLLTQIASALDAAHAHGLVHRDVKPANLLVTGEYVYLTDFGIAKSQQDVRELTRIGLFVGTVDYASPEQIRNEPLDGRSDLYSLACVFYQCLVGQVPFDRATEHAVIQAHLNEQPGSVHALRPELPASLDGVFAIALAKNAADRYRTCHHFAEAIRAALESRVASPERPTVIDGLAARTPAVTTAVQSLSSTTRTRARGPSRIQGILVMLIAVAGAFTVGPRLLPATLNAASPAPSALATAASTFTLTRPTVLPTPTPAPTHPYPVLFSADQVIMPPSEFPLPGYSVARDERSGQFGWNRQYMSTASYWYVSIYVTVSQAPVHASDQLAAETCDWNFSTPTNAREITAEVIAEGAKACQYTFTTSTAADWFVYTTASRNVLVQVGVEPRLTSITPAGAIAQAVAIAKLQLSIVERVSPR